MAGRVGKYLLFEIIGEGAFGKVKLAVNEETGDQVAIKIMDKSSIKAKEMTMQVRREIAIMKALKHKNIVNMHEVLSSKTKLYIVMDLVSGGELFDKILDEGKLEENTARAYFQQMIDGVDYCHKKGICHRDLKPENLLIDEQTGELKITDFGLSAMLQVDTPGDLLHTQCGSPNYVAPEVISSAEKGYSGPKVDTWSCGIILYALCTGFLPFFSEKTSELYRMIQHDKVSYPKGFPRGARDLCERLLCKNPTKRITLPEVKKHPWFIVDYEEDTTGNPTAKKKKKKTVLSPSTIQNDEAFSVAALPAKPEAPNSETAKGSAEPNDAAPDQEQQTAEVNSCPPADPSAEAPAAQLRQEENQSPVAVEPKPVAQPADQAAAADPGRDDECGAIPETTACATIEAQADVSADDVGEENTEPAGSAKDEQTSVGADQEEACEANLRDSSPLPGTTEEAEGQTESTTCREEVGGSDSQLQEEKSEKRTKSIGFVESESAAGVADLGLEPIPQSDADEASCSKSQEQEITSLRTQNKTRSITFRDTNEFADRSDSEDSGSEQPALALMVSQDTSGNTLCVSRATSVQEEGEKSMELAQDPPVDLEMPSTRAPLSILCLERTTKGQFDDLEDDVLQPSASVRESRSLTDVSEHASNTGPESHGTDGESEAGFYHPPTVGDRPTLFADLDSIDPTGEEEISGAGEPKDVPFPTPSPRILPTGGSIFKKLNGEKFEGLAETMAREGSMLSAATSQVGFREPDGFSRGSSQRQASQWSRSSSLFQRSGMFRERSATSVDCGTSNSRRSDCSVRSDPYYERLEAASNRYRGLFQIESSGRLMASKSFVRMSMTSSSIQILQARALTASWYSRLLQEIKWLEKLSTTEHAQGVTLEKLDAYEKLLDFWELRAVSGRAKGLTEWWTDPEPLTPEEQTQLRFLVGDLEIKQVDDIQLVPIPEDPSALDSAGDIAQEIATESSPLPPEEATPARDTTETSEEAMESSNEVVRDPFRPRTNVQEDRGRTQSQESFSHSESFTGRSDSYSDTLADQLFSASPLYRKKSKIKSSRTTDGIAAQMGRMFGWRQRQTGSSNGRAPGPAVPKGPSASASASGGILQSLEVEERKRSMTGRQIDSLLPVSECIEQVLRVLSELGYSSRKRRTEKDALRVEVPVARGEPLLLVISFSKAVEQGEPITRIDIRRDKKDRSRLDWIELHSAQDAIQDGFLAAVDAQGLM